MSIMKASSAPKECLDVLSDTHDVLNVQRSFNSCESRVGSYFGGMLANIALAKEVLK